MRSLGISGDIVANTTVIDGQFENGCRALIVGPNAKRDARKLWERARDAFELTCAHIKIEQHESGCVFDVFRETACPCPPQT